MGYHITTIRVAPGYYCSYSTQSRTKVVYGNNMDVYFYQYEKPGIFEDCQLASVKYSLESGVEKFINTITGNPCGFFVGIGNIGFENSDVKIYRSIAVYL